MAPLYYSDAERLETLRRQRRELFDVHSEGRAGDRRGLRFELARLDRMIRTLEERIALDERAPKLTER
jgi:hypothetical protein